MKKLSGCDCKGCIDLHIHSTASDGTFSPSEILSEALNLGLKAIAITDHDTFEGYRSALESGIPDDFNLISGVEISVSPPKGFGIRGSVHILGYGVRVGDPDLSSCLRLLRGSRLDRAKKIFDRLKSLGFFISEKDVFEKVHCNVIGRPHIANIMINMGFVDSFNEAFDRFLGRGKPAYVDKKRINIGEILALINSAGGVSVLAHPYLIGIKNISVFENFISELKHMGLMGIEAVYPKHSKTMIDFYLRVARKHGLLVTGGTDFHGDNTTGSSMGIGTGDFCVPFVFYENLLKLLGKS